MIQFIDVIDIDDFHRSCMIQFIDVTHFFLKMQQNKGLDLFDSFKLMFNFDTLFHYNWNRSRFKLCSPQLVQVSHSLDSQGFGLKLNSRLFDEQYI